MVMFVSADVYEECDKYDITTDADADVENDDEVPTKRQYKRKANDDFVHPSDVNQSTFALYRIVAKVCVVWKVTAELYVFVLHGACWMVKAGVAGHGCACSLQAFAGKTVIPSPHMPHMIALDIIHG